MPINNSKLSEENNNTTTNNNLGKPIFLDWEFIGIGSGPAELGWYMIFHVDPEVRQTHEEEFLMQVIIIIIIIITSNNDKI